MKRECVDQKESPWIQDFKRSDTQVLQMPSGRGKIGVKCSPGREAAIRTARTGCIFPRKEEFPSIDLLALIHVCVSVTDLWKLLDRR